MSVANIDSQFSTRCPMDRIVQCVTTKFQILGEVACETSQATGKGRNGLTRATAGQGSETRRCRKERERRWVNWGKEGERGRGRERRMTSRERRRPFGHDGARRPYDPLATTPSRMPPSNATLPLVPGARPPPLRPGFLSLSLPLSFYLPPGTM